MHFWWKLSEIVKRFSFGTAFDFSARNRFCHPEKLRHFKFWSLKFSTGYSIEADRCSCKVAWEVSLRRSLNFAKSNINNDRSVLVWFLRWYLLCDFYQDYQEIPLQNLLSTYSFLRDTSTQIKKPNRRLWPF